MRRVAEIAPFPAHSSLACLLDLFAEHTEEDEVVYEEAPQPHIIDTGDSVKVKQVLDDAAMEIIAKEGYEGNFSWDNMKLLLMFVACVFALVAQFYPMPFPQSRPLLGICCACYFIISGVLQFIVTFIDKDTIMFTKPKSVRLTIPLLHIAV